MRVLRWAWENLPMLLAFVAAFYAGYVEQDQGTMRFFIIMAAFFMVLRELSEIRYRVIALAESEQPTTQEPESKPNEPETVGLPMEHSSYNGRHHGAD